MMYADEFGVLRHVETNAEFGHYKNSAILNNSELYLTNKLINTQPAQSYDYTNATHLLSLSNFAFSYYVSRHFTIQDSMVTTYYGLMGSNKIENPDSMNIKVVDELGNKIVDENGKNKYEIYLDKYYQNYVKEYQEVNSSSIYRIVVLLHDANPINFSLIYDKIELSASGIADNQFLGFKETINSMPLYSRVAEESEVVDPSSFDRTIYSTQLFSQKENKILKHKVDQPGWKAFVPQKAFQDPRTFQKFNWRIVGKIVNNFNVIKNIYSDDEKPIIKAAVLKTEKELNSKYPYVFSNIENYPFNNLSYIFQNPAAEELISINGEAIINFGKSSRKYWEINIEDSRILSLDLDIVYWYPISDITDEQYATIVRLIQKGTSVFVDCSALKIYQEQKSGLEKFGLNYSSEFVSSGYVNINSTYSKGNSTLNAWDISEFDEVSDTAGATPSILDYGIFGPRKNILKNEINKIKTFSSSSDWVNIQPQTIISIGQNAIIIKKPIVSLFETGLDANRPSVYFSSENISHLLNNSFGTGILGVGTENSGETNIVSSNTNAAGTVIEGACKFFYNVIVESIKNKTISLRQQNSDSSILWHVSPWRNSWTINGERVNGVVKVLSEQEKSKYKFSDKTEITTDQAASAAKTFFSRELMVDGKSSLTDIFMSDFKQHSTQDASIINRDFSNVEFYIECTNTNVGFVNFKVVEDKDYFYTFDKNYSVYKISESAMNQVKALSPITINSYSNVYSIDFDETSITYPFVVVDDSDYLTTEMSINKVSKSLLTGTQAVKDYDIDLNVSYSYKSLTENSSSYTVKWSVPFYCNISGNGILKNKRPKRINNTQRLTVGIKEISDKNITIKDASSPFNNYPYSTKIFSRTDILSTDLNSISNTFNNFHFTDDVAKSGRWDEWAVYSYMLTGSTSGQTATSSTVDSSNVSVSPSLNTYKYTYSGPIAYSISTNSLGGFQMSSDFYTNIGGLVAPVNAVFLQDILVYINENTVESLWNHFLSFCGRYLNSSLNKDAKGKRLIKDLSEKPTSFWIERYATIMSPKQAVLVKPNNPTTIIPPPPILNQSNSQASFLRGSYVKYIQYTLNQNGSSLKVDGVYGTKTKTEVLKFQRSSGLERIDGIVDSQTKSVMATYWLRTLKNTPTIFATKRTNAPEKDIKDYIDRAINYSDISQVGKKEYRRISFTGVKGPTAITDFLIIKLPENSKIFHGFTFQSGNWNTILENVWFYNTDLANGRHIIPDYKSSSVRSVYSKYINKNVPPNSSLYISAENLKDIKYIMLKVKGDKIAGLGPNAEGYSLMDVSFDITRETVVNTTEPFDDEAVFAAYAAGMINGTTTISSGGYGTIDLNRSTSNIIYSDQNTKIDEVYFDEVYVDAIDGIEADGDVKFFLPIKIEVIKKNLDNKFYLYSNRTRNNSLISYRSNDGNISFSLKPFDSGRIFIFDQPSIDEAYKNNVNPTSLQEEPVSRFNIKKDSQISVGAGSYIVTTDYGSSVNVLQSSTEVLINKNTKTSNGIWIKDADDSSKVLRQNPFTINASDGVVVLSKQDGSPFGFPDFAQIRNAPANTSINFGDIILSWNRETTAPYGLRWEFYNVATKTFYGKKISYYDYIYGNPNNIYVALLAYDADGDSATSNIVGSDDTIINIDPLPHRFFAPLYAVSLSSKSKISIEPPPPDLSKFDSWFIKVGSGSFYKQIDIPQKEYSNFMKNHSGKKLRCFYDTTGIEKNVANIFGSGHYDVMDEHPIVISDNEIKVRHGSFHVFQHQVFHAGFNTKFSDANPILPAVKIKIKNQQNNSWQEVDSNLIFDFNKNSGNIVFKKEIVPSDPFKIKVSYVVKSSDILLRHVGGSEIPLNPFGVSSYELNKPLYIYLMPKSVEYYDGNFLIEENDYINKTLINWTDDYGIFNQHRENYDPLALHLATVSVVSNYSFERIKFNDLRVKGGGLSGLSDPKALAESDKSVLSFADIYSGKGYVYPNGGYVIVKIPKEVKNYFTSQEQIYSIVRSNLTAGVSFDIQDLEGNDWRTI